MIEPTESYTKMELDRFADAVVAIKDLIENYPKWWHMHPTSHRSIE